MMKLWSILAISLFAVSRAAAQTNNDTNRLPSFVFDMDYFVQNNRSKVRFTIKFHDGGNDDVALLNYINPIVVPGEDPAKIDPCIFKGRLVNEPDASVSLIGCPGQELLEVVVNSMRLEDEMFYVVNGTVEALRVDEENDDLDIATGSEKTNVESRDLLGKTLIPLPHRLVLNMSLYYDSKFYKKFGYSYSNSYNELRRIVAATRTIFELSSLGTKIALHNVNMGRYYSSLDSSKDIKRVMSSARSTGTYAHIYIYMTHTNNNHTTGMSATVGSVCAQDRGLRTAIVEYNSTTLDAARVMARQIGHLLGMWPDFKTKNGKRTANPTRNDRDSNSCTNQDGIMDYYGSKRNKWSTCSKEDLQLYYNHIVRSDGAFCAPDCTVDIGPGCDFWKRKGICTKGNKLEVYCGKTCDYCRRFFEV